MFYGRGLAVLEKSGINVIAETFDGLARDPLYVFLCNRRRFDEVENVVRIG